MKNYSKKVTIEDGEVVVKYNIENLDIFGCFDAVFEDDNATNEFFARLFWNAFELSQGYYPMQNKEMNDAILPIIYNFDAYNWFVDVGFFMEILGKFIYEKLNTDHTKAYYNYAERVLKDGGESSLLRKILVAKFEIIDDFLKQNDYAMYVKKGRKMKFEPKFYTRKVIEKIDSYGESEQFIMNVIPILGEKIKPLIDNKIFEDIMNSQKEIGQKMLNKTVYEYFDECKKELKMQKYYEYVYGDYDKYAAKM